MTLNVSQTMIKFFLQYRLPEFVKFLLNYHQDITEKEYFEMLEKANERMVFFAQNFLKIFT